MGCRRIFLIGSVEKHMQEDKWILSVPVISEAEPDSVFRHRADRLKSCSGGGNIVNILTNL